MSILHRLGDNVTDNVPNNVQIAVGTDEATSNGILYNIEKMIPHEKYRRHYNDIGLAKVQGTIQFNKNVQPIIYSNIEVLPGTELLATGWGLTQVNIFFCLFFNFREKNPIFFHSLCFRYGNLRPIIYKLLH